MGLGTRVFIGALGVGELAARVALDTGKTLVTEGKKAYKNNADNPEVIPVMKAVANVVASTAAAGANSTWKNGAEIGAVCYKDICADIEQDRQEKMAEQERLKELEDKVRRELLPKRLAEVRAERERKRKEEEEQKRREEQEQKELEEFRKNPPPVTSKFPKDGYIYHRSCCHCKRNFYIHKRHFVHRKGTYYACPYCGAKPSSSDFD